MEWPEPKDTNNPDDVRAADRYIQLKFGMFANPIFGNGDYPDVLKDQLVKKATELGLTKSPLLPFSDVETKFIRG